MKKLIPILIVGLALLSSTFYATNSDAVPAFARKYQTSCSTCHYAFPRLNPFGRAFYNNGLRYPGDDQAMVKEPPVSLGAEAYKKVFPDAIWPADMPGTTPISFQMISQMHYTPEDKGNEFSFENPHALEAFMPGTIGENISFWAELEWEGNEFGYGGWMDYKFSDPFHVRVGDLAYLPIHDHAALTAEGFNYGDFAERDGSGLKVWGAVNGPKDRGGFVYEAGVVNGQNNGANLDVNSQKDVFGKVSYKIGGLGVLGGGTNSSATSAFWRDNSVTLGGYGYLGEDADFTKVRTFGGRTDIFYNDLNVFALVLSEGMKAPGDIDYTKDTRGFVEGDYVIYPWFIPMLRYEFMKPQSQNGVSGNAEEDIVPGVVLMARANVKIVPTGYIDLNGHKENNRYTILMAVGF